MADSAKVDTPAGVEVDDDAAVVAAEIVAIVRSATTGLPFGTDPGTYLALLDELAGEPAAAGNGPAAGRGR